MSYICFVMFFFPFVLFIFHIIMFLRGFLNLINLNLNLLLAIPRRLLCNGSLVILDLASCRLWLFSLYINIVIRKIFKC